MSEETPKKLIGGILAIALLGVGAYFFLGSQSPGSSSSLLVSTSTGANGTAGEVDTAQIIRQLNQLQDIEMDTSFFNSPAFLSLQDFTVTLRSQPIGRQNPFVPPTYVQQGGSIIPNENPVHQRPIDQIDTSEEEESTEPEATTTSEDSDDQSTSTADTDNNSTTTEAGN